jgi:hypothetical protein
MVAVIVATNPPVVRGTSSQVDVSKTVTNDLLVFKPDLLLQ